MSEKKMIIRNCPAIYGIDDGFLCSYREDDEDEKYCYDCTDCLLKQIYKKCKNTIIQNPNQEDDTFEFDVGRESLGTEIIGLLDIEEAE